MSVFNKSERCECGKWKNERMQWCEWCFDLLTEEERNTFAKKAGNLRQFVAGMESRIVQRRYQRRPWPPETIRPGAKEEQEVAK